MSDEFSVDLNQLEQIVARLSGLSGFISQQLDGLDEKVAALNGTGWESAAADAYATAHREWSGRARELSDGILVMSAAAERQFARYTAAVDANSQMVNGA